MSLAAAERAALADLLDTVGPDRPTLCAGWTTRDLLAHLLVRERQPWVAPTILVPALGAVAEKAMEGYAGVPWGKLVQQFRSGPPLWSPFRLTGADALANAAEHFVHHEDVRRAEPGWEPRPPDPARDAELWALVGRIGRAMYRRSPVGVVLRRPDGNEHAVNPGTGRVTITGEPGELLLHAFGREALRIETGGVEADITAMAAVAREL